MDRLYHILPAIAGAVFLVAGIIVASSRSRSSGDRTWLFPAILMVLFAGWTAHAVVAGGLLGFWTEHVRNGWGNQIWFDLLLCAGTAFVLIVPRARALEMALLPWFLAIAATGSVGLLAMIARMFYLEARQRNAQALYSPSSRTP